MESSAASELARELAALREELVADLGDDERAHFAKMSRWGRACTALGYATAWIAPNPVSAALLSLGTTARWTIVAHHTSHRGMDKVPGGPRSTTFAKGWRRWVDWLDWMSPEAWAYEHNSLHHYRTGEEADPDLLERNLEAFRSSDMPRAVKWAVVGFYACTWRLTYYAPSTWQVLRRAENQRKAKRGEPHEEVPLHSPHVAEADPRTPHGRAFLRSLAPYAFTRFVAAPAAFLPLGPWAAGSVLANTVAAEVLTNLHTFAIIVPNHAGDDVVRFDEAGHDRDEFAVRQIVGSVNYTGGTDISDFLQGFLNYQIEHHLWPDLPPLTYRKAQPRVQALCEKYGVPYVIEGLGARIRKMLAIAVGDASMKRAADARPLARAPVRHAMAEQAL
jgi:fatty acid desaturase